MFPIKMQVSLYGAHFPEHTGHYSKIFRFSHDFDTVLSPYQGHLFFKRTIF